MSRTAQPPLLSSWGAYTLFGALLAAGAGGSCTSTGMQSRPLLEFSIHLGEQEFFEAEPVYLVFRLTNRGTDTAWVKQFELAALNLRAAVSASDGSALPEWGIVVDYTPAPGWRGIAVAPGASLFDIGKVQDRWGRYDKALQDLYQSHHLPAGRYRLQAWFDWDPHPASRGSAPLEADEADLVVRPRTAWEDTLYDNVQRLAAMRWDSTQRHLFLAALVDYAERHAAVDVTDPYLPFLTLDMVAGAKGVGLWPDSATVDRLDAVRIAVAEAQRFSPAGATAVLAVYADRPALMSDLAERLGSSLAGDVAAALAEKYRTRPFP